MCCPRIFSRCVQFYEDNFRWDHQFVCKIVNIEKRERPSKEISHNVHSQKRTFIFFISDWLGEIWEENFSSELSEAWFIESKKLKDDDVMIHLYSASYGNTESVLSL